ncbi:MAG: SurA N-terminal domain-containing protein, partial [Omnitrophica WOR_2 bacterium]
MPKASKNKILTKKHLARIERERLQRRYILIASLAVLILVAGFIGYGILDQTVLQPLQPIVKVNGDSVSTRDWQAQVRYTRQNIIQQYAQTYAFAQSFGSDPQTLQYFQSSLQQMQSQLDPFTLGQQVLDTTIQDLLIKQEAKRRGIVVTDQELDTILKNDFGYYPNGTPTPAPTDLPTLPAATLSAAQLAMVTATPTMTPTHTSTPTATPKPGSPTQTPTVIPSPTLVPSPTLTPTPYTEQAFKDNYQKTLDVLKNIQVSDAQFREIIRMQ